jgi:signal transduction histidine kinase
LEEGQREQA